MSAFFWGGWAQGFHTKQRLVRGKALETSMEVVRDHHDPGKFEPFDPLVGAIGAAIFDIGIGEVARHLGKRGLERLRPGLGDGAEAERLGITQGQLIEMMWEEYQKLAR